MNRIAQLHPVRACSGRRLLPTLALCVALAACAPLPTQQPAGSAPTMAAAGAQAMAPQMQAECTPLLDALLRARGQPHLRQYQVDGAMFPVAAEPLAYRVGDVVHEMEQGLLVARQLPEGRDPLVDALRGELERGTASCHVDGKATFHGAPAQRVTFQHPQVDAYHNPATLLIDVATGLPVFHSYANMPDQGFAWIYGSEPLAPMAKWRPQSQRGSGPAAP